MELRATPLHTGLPLNEEVVRRCRTRFLERLAERRRRATPGGEGPIEAPFDEGQQGAEDGALAEAARDLEVVRRALAGDREALQRVFERVECLPVLVRMRNQRLGAPLGPADLDDVVQNALMALWRKLPHFDGRSPLDRWAYGFAVIETIKCVERRGRRSARARGLEEAEGVADPGDAFASSEGRDAVTLALAQLEERDARILSQRHLEDLSFDEIAAREGMLANSVKTRYYRGIKRLRDVLSRGRPPLPNA